MFVLFDWCICVVIVIIITTTNEHTIAGTVSIRLANKQKIENILRLGNLQCLQHKQNNEMTITINQNPKHYLNNVIESSAWILKKAN